MIEEMITPAPPPAMRSRAGPIWTSSEACLHELWFFGGTTEIQKEIIARGLGL